MYHRGISTLMLAEVYGMTDKKLSKEIKAKLERAVAVLLQAQVQQPGVTHGGWRYTVQPNDADISVTGRPAASAPQAPAPSPAKTYTVKAGDTLSGIAKATLGNAGAYMKIFELNKDQLTDPDKIQPGQVLRLP